MKITYKMSPSDPPYPIMIGDSPLSKEFNKRQKDIWAAGKIAIVDYEQVMTVVVDILSDDYNERHGTRKKKTKVG